MNRCRGLVTLMALAVLAVAAVAITSVASLTAVHLDRTGAAGRDAQLRQMLTAAATVAAQRVDAWTPADANRTYVVPLPEALIEREGVALVWFERVIADVERIAHVQASLDGQRAGQTLRFVRGRDRWSLYDARLGGPGDRGD